MLKVLRGRWGSTSHGPSLFEALRRAVAQEDEEVVASGLTDRGPSVKRDVLTHLSRP